METLKDLFHSGAKFAGYAAIVDWVAVVGSYYAWQFTGWAWLAGFNAIVISALTTILWAGAALMAAVLVLKIGMWIKGLFGSAD